MLFFRTSQFYTLNESFLGKEECNNDRHCEDCCGSHELIPDECALTLEILQAKRHGEILRAGEKEQRPSEVIPRPEKRENSHGGKHRHGKRDDQLGKNLPLGSAVHAGGIAHLFRDGAEELPQKEYIVGIRKKGWNDDRQEGVAPVQEVVE